MVKSLTFDQIRAQIPQAVRETFAKPKDQRPTTEELASQFKQTPYEREMAKIPNGGCSGTE